ncbi:hypothetical protein CHELA40_30094 [Chelatococcus asaccharovorans]|nr:hypothetical protein CHELA17_40321 [Chelatococcus asaccharovorans]CAH1687887.1 hypothetical protein CHELA40_30094 [Chelatococcus asaccharovorans]
MLRFFYDLRRTRTVNGWIVSIVQRAGGSEHIKVDGNLSCRVDIKQTCGPNSGTVPLRHRFRLRRAEGRPLLYNFRRQQAIRSIVLRVPSLSHEWEPRVAR